MSDTTIIICAGLGASLFALALSMPGFALVASHRRDRKRWAAQSALKESRDGT